MKKLLVLIFVASLTGCEPSEQPLPPYTRKRETVNNSTPGSIEHRIIEIDGCEYIESVYNPGGADGLYSLIHKGNCKNPVHRYAVPSEPTSDER